MPSWISLTKFTRIKVQNWRGTRDLNPHLFSVDSGVHCLSATTPSWRGVVLRRRLKRLQFYSCTVLRLRTDTEISCRVQSGVPYPA
jgi:hypothetical protein